jgi:hypothetical protein
MPLLLLYVFCYHVHERYGVMLKKVANFYNNVEGQIIDAQKPMLLDALLAFEEVTVTCVAVTHVTVCNCYWKLFKVIH